MNRTKWVKKSFVELCMQYAVERGCFTVSHLFLNGANENRVQTILYTCVWMSCCQTHLFGALLPSGSQQQAASSKATIFVYILPCHRTKITLDNTFGSFSHDGMQIIRKYMNVKSHIFFSFVAGCQPDDRIDFETKSKVPRKWGIFYNINFLNNEVGKIYLPNATIQSYASDQIYLMHCS